VTSLSLRVRTSHAAHACGASGSPLCCLQLGTSPWTAEMGYHPRSRQFAKLVCSSRGSCHSISQKRSRNYQPACKPGSVWRFPSATAIHLGRPLLSASSDQPGRRVWKRTWRHAFKRAPGRPYLVLLPVGFALPRPSPDARCALTAPFHPYLEDEAVCFLWHFPWGRPRRPLAATVSPWSPDFPPPVCAYGP